MLITKKGSKFFNNGEEEKKEYANFPLITETETEGYTFGAITDFLTPDSEYGCISGDGYVQTPDGSRVGLDWVVNEKEEIRIIQKPEKGISGVYEINFPKPIKTINDLVFNFRKVLPILKTKLA
jgi:hypothetical protein